MSYVMILVTMSLFIIRYGEIGLKSGRVRRRFEDALLENLMRAFVRANLECRIERERGRVYLWSDSVEGSIEILGRTFGIVSFSQAVETTSSKGDIQSMVVKVSKERLGPDMSFRIRARRTGQHDYTSMELASDLGAAVLEANNEMKPRVDLHDPDLEIHVEVRHNRAFVFTEVIPGPGGMPLGTQGRVLCPLRDERDVAATWLMMKRGCQAVVVTENTEFAEWLKSWDPEPTVVQEAPCSAEELAILAGKLEAEGIALGQSFEDFKRTRGNGSAPVPSFHPLIGMTDERIRELLDRIRI